VSSTGEYKIRGRLIRQDEDGFVCVTDIHRAAGFTKNLRPTDFIRLQQTIAIMPVIHEKLVGKNHKFKMSNIWRTKPGPDGGTYAHPLMALAYAEYLSPKLAVEVREVFLRYRAGDATLADEVLEKASAEANEWAGKRALARAVRKGYTATLASHGVSQPADFARCTNATYEGLFGRTAKQLKKERGIARNLRDAMDMRELAFVMAAEALSSERIEEEKSGGPVQCRSATSKSARFIRSAIEADRKDRMPGQKNMF